MVWGGSGGLAATTVEAAGANHPAVSGRLQSVAVKGGAAHSPLPSAARARLALVRGSSQRRMTVLSTPTSEQSRFVGHLEPPLPVGGVRAALAFRALPSR